MGICCSKWREPSKEMSIMKEKNDSSKAEEFVEAAISATTKRASCITEGKDKSTGETPVKQSSHLEEEKCSKAYATVIMPGKPLSCTKEEVDAILIQCGRLSRNSSGKTSNEMAGQKRHSGSKKSYDFDNDGKEEGEAFDKSSSRPSPRPRTRCGSSEGRRASGRSPGRRSDSPASSTCDKPRQYPAKMISVPATEKGVIFVNVDTDGARSRSPANNYCISNESAKSQSMSRCSSRKADGSPFRRNPMAEMDENSLRSQNGGDISILQRSREVDDKAIQSLIIDMSKADIVKEEVDAKLNGGVETLNPLILTRTRSSRKSSRDLDNNPIVKSASNAPSVLTVQENIQNHQQNTAFSFPTSASKAFSCSEQRSPETDQSNNNSFRKSGLARRVSIVLQRETLAEVNVNLKKPSIRKYVTARDAMPQESTGSNSCIGEPSATSWDLNSVDSTDHSLRHDIEVEVEDDVSQKGNQQLKILLQEPIGGQRSNASSNGNSDGRATPLGKKSDYLQLNQSGHGFGCGNVKIDGRGISVHLSAATS